MTAVRFKKLADDKSIVDKIMIEIKNSLIQGDLKLGDKLPPERELTEKYGVSRGAVREAVKMLVALGVVEIKRGDGTYITKKVPHSGLNQLIFSLIQEEGTPQELLELREMLEIGILDIILEKATEKDIQKMEKAIEALETGYTKGISDSKIPSKLDLEFHYAFAEATHNPLITKIFHAVIEMFEPTIEKSLRVGRGPLRGAKIHRKILQAIKKRDIEKAKKAIYDSLQVWKRTAYISSS